MTLQTRYPVKAFLPEQSVLGCSFAPNGTSNPTDVSKGIKVVRTGVGVYTVTLDTQAASIVSLGTDETCLTAGLFRAAAGGVTRTNGALTWAVTLLNAAGTAAEVAANAANRVYFTIVISSMSTAAR